MANGKNIIKVILPLLAIFSNPAISLAQPHPCGTTLTPIQLNYLNQTRTLRQDFDRAAQRILPLSLPVQHHIVRQSDSTGGLNPSSLTGIMASLNSYYQNAGVQFYECASVHYIDIDSFYDFNETQESALASANDVANVINIYHFNSLTSESGGSLCGYAYFPPGPDRIMMDKDCSVNGTTIVHELGHYLALYHTHGKTNCGTTDELADSSNCTDHGDDICDTPADPNLLDYQNNCGSYLVNSSCVYIGTYTDANGDTYNPLTNNIMSYSRSSCRNSLTNGQYNRALYSALYDRDYLTCSSCPDPANAQASNESIYSAQLNWTSSNAWADYSVEWGVAGFYFNGTDSAGSATGVSIAGANSVTASGLNPATDYEFIVWEDCGSMVSGIGPVSFSTLTLVNDFPSCEDFESFSLCGTSCGAACILTNGWKNLTSGDNTNWTADENDTPTNNTGPATDHTSGTTTGNYIYVEASNSCFPTKTAIVLSPAYDLSSIINPTFEFWHHLYGAAMGSLAADIENPFGSGNWVNLFSLSGNQGNAWNNAVIDISAYSGNIVRFRFTGVTGTNFTSDMAVDDVCVKENIPPVVTLSGAIHTELDTPVAGVTVILSGDESDTVVTGSDGVYGFNVASGGDYIITPSKSNDSITNNGVTTGDISLIRKHVLTGNFFTSPYKIIAADANNSGTITTGDISFARRVVLNNTNTFPITTNPSIAYGRLWEFVSSDQAFTGPPYNPFPFTKTRAYSNVTANQTNQDFIGIKLGDVNGNWNAGIP